jgi:N utilization substance protein B
MGDYLQLFSTRTHARIMALRLLYQSEITGRTIDDLLEDDACLIANEYEHLCIKAVGDAGLKHECEQFNACEYRMFFQQYNGEIDSYSLKIAHGVESQRDNIDGAIEAVSQNWHISRMPVVDRNIARIATWEIMQFSPEVPASVAIHEAVNIAKEYGGADSSKFVNGVLGEIEKSCAAERNDCDTD